jgi:hypothetical protein
MKKEEDLAQLPQLLARIAIALERLAPASTEPLGFCEPPIRKKIFINQSSELDENYLWYFWDGVKEQKIPILQGALTGKIVAIEIDESQEFKGQQIQKLHLSIDADRPYKIITGINTFTARSLVLNIFAAYGLGILGSPLTIALRKGEGTTFSSFYQGSELITTSWDTDTPLPEYLTQINLTP